ncbi:MAG TPA: ATPase, T2SS/T4P/T4SS family [Roseomonas sp.]|nr:ATPase, T2SS/T4P/T4SS family [Roseomonas sp.]
MHPAIPMLDYAMAPIADLFQDPTTQDVAVNEPGQVWWRQGGGWSVRQQPELDFQTLESIAMLAGSLRGQDVDERSPLLSTEMPAPAGEGGRALLRLQAVLPPAVPGASISLTWRRPGNMVAPLDAIPERYQTEGWNASGQRGAARQRLSGELLALYDQGDAVGFLTLAMRRKLNIWMCAATGGGKTDLFKSLMAAVPAEERIVTVEDSQELILSQPNTVRLLYSQTGGGTGAAELIAAAMRMRPDRVPVQEIRTGEAAWVYLGGILSGHPGSPTTIHGRTPQEAFRRMFNFCKAAGGTSMADHNLAGMLGDAVDIIIPLRNEAGVFSIREVWFKDAVLRDGGSPATLLADHDL